jgi:YfiH family protein
LPTGALGVFTTRSGGSSAPPWAELNLSLDVGDGERTVLANRDLTAGHIGVKAIVFPRQQHGCEVSVVDTPSTTGALECDALVTQTAGVAIGVLAADCLPVLLADPVHRVVAVAHAGRRGLVAGVLQATVARMVESGADPEQMTAVIGPGVCGRCYEVPEQMQVEVADMVPGTWSTTAQGTPALDLAAGASYALAASGVGDVRSTGICTVEDSRWYSHRRDGRTGRFAGVVVLRAPELSGPRAGVAVPSGR